MRHFHIIDPQLGNKGGHYFPYAKSVTAEAVSQASQVFWHTNKSFVPYHLLNGVVVNPIFERDIFDEVNFQEENWIISNFNTLNAEFYKTLVEKIPPPTANSTVLFPNLLHNQLYAVIEWSRNYCQESKVFAILRWNNALMHYNCSRGATRQIEYLYRFCFDKSISVKRNLTIASDTLRLAEYYSRLATYPIEHFPNPQVPDCEISGLAFSGRKDNHDNIVISHLGGYISLRGSHLLPDLFYNTLLTNKSVAIRCHVNDFSSPDFHKLMTVVNQFKTRITVLGNFVDDTLYKSLCQTTDLIVMAYNPTFYKYGSSGVACEALSWGIPAVIPANTTIADEFRSVDAGFIESNHWTVEAYTHAIAAAVNDVRTLTEKSRHAKVLYRKMVSPQAFLSRILN